MTTKLEATPYEGTPIDMTSNEKPRLARDAERRIVIDADQKGGMKFTCICNSSYRDEVSITYTKNVDNCIVRPSIQSTIAIGLTNLWQASIVLYC